jgi:hypothetical protein
VGNDREYETTSETKNIMRAASRLLASCTLHA